MFQAPQRRVTRTFLHCSASEVDLTGKELVDEIRAWHMDPNRPGGPFNDIGYHFVIDKLGQRLTGRDLERQPAAQAPHNAATLAICVHGLVFSSDWYMSSQADGVRQLCLEINLAYSGVMAFWPHNAVANKACPVFDEVRLLDLDRWRRMP